MSNGRPADRHGPGEISRRDAADPPTRVSRLFAVPGSWFLIPLRWVFTLPPGVAGEQDTGAVVVCVPVAPAAALDVLDAGLHQEPRRAAIDGPPPSRAAVVDACQPSARIRSL